MPITNLDYNRVYEEEPTEASVRDSIYNSNGGTASEDMEEATKLMIGEAKKFLKGRKYVYDFNTPNKSFTSMYRDLKKLGINNNKFFLKLYDTDLIGVSPYQKILPKEMWMKIALECVINPWYFLREVCRIPVEGAPIETGGGVEFELDRNNLASWYLFLNRIDDYQVKPRQCGKTQNKLAQMNYAFHFGASSSNFLFFSKELSLSKLNLYRLKSQRDLFPEYLQMKVVVTEEGKAVRGSDNLTFMSNPITQNTIMVMPRATSHDVAEKLGRGHTAAFHLYDEFEFIPWIDTILKSAAFSYSKASENAKKNGSLSIRGFSSTPGDIDSRDGAAAFEWIDKMLVWKDTFFDLPIGQLSKISSSVGYNGIVYIKHTWRQLKKSVEWYEKQCELVGYHQDTILREIDLQRIAGSSTSPFKREDLIYLEANVREPFKTVDYSKNLCPICIYENLHKNYPYIISVDPSEGLAQDNNAFTVINPYTQGPVAEFKSPYISQPDLAKIILRFMDEFCPKALVVIEANKGRELINRLRETKYRYQVWYDTRKINDRVIDNTDQYGLLKKQSYERRAFGFDTTSSSRPVLFEILEYFVEERKDRLYTQYIVKDIMALERRPTGKIVARDKHHDDNIMSFLIGLNVYFNADLSEWGIEKGATAPPDPNRELTDQEKKIKMSSILSMLPDEIRDMFQDTINETDPIEASNKYYQEIQSLSRKEPGYDDESIMLTDEDLDERIKKRDADIFENNFLVDTTVNIEDWI
jgi:hypothetical protein